MNYLIVSDSYEPFFTNWFNAKGNFNEDDNMIVFNLIAGTYTIDGETWEEIKEDHL